MKKSQRNGRVFFLSILILACTLHISVFAEDINESVYSGTCGEVSWEFDGGVLIISGTGKMEPTNKDSKYYKYPWSAYNDTIVTVIIEDGVVNIGEFAFDGCSNLNEISIADSVKTIEKGAFYKCSSLEEIALPENVEIGAAAFSWCNNLSGISLPENMTSIPDGLLRGCENLENITIPSGVTQIGNSAFNYCNKLSDIVIPQGVTSIGAWSFGKCLNLENITLPSTLTDIGEYAFYGCISISEITIPDSVTKLNRAAFEQCKNLKKVHISKHARLSEIGLDAFCSCSNLSEITIPNQLTCISMGAFQYCTSLKTIDIPDEVLEIQSHAFFECFNLTDVNIGVNSKIRTIGDSAFYRCHNLRGEFIIPGEVNYVGQDTFFGCKNLTGIRISEKVTKIKDMAFAGCKSLKSINIPDAVTSIGLRAFNGCTNLKRANIPDGIKKIENETFAGCKSLESMSLPDSVTKIGDNAFNNCESLRSINIPRDVTYIGKSAFYGCSNLDGSITIPKGIDMIKSNTFYGCSKLDYVDFTYGASCIAGGAFQGCKELKDITIPESVTDIFNGAFKNCESLTYLKLPFSVTNIENQAFALSDGKENVLRTVYFKGNAPKMGTDVFGGVTANIYYPICDASWRKIINKNHGGDLVWIPWNPITGVRKTIDISECSIELEETEYNFDTRECCPKVIVKMNSRLLNDRIDYSVSYTDNINAGTATVIVTGKGAYSGSIRRNFVINKAENSISASNYTKSCSKKTQTFPLQMRQKGTGMVTYFSNNKNVQVDKCTGKIIIAANYIGTATITIHVDKDENYNSSIHKIKVIVIPQKMKMPETVIKKDGKIVVKWKKNNIVSGYQIRYSTFPDFARNEKKKTLKKSSVTSTSISNLKKGRTYYISIRSYKKVLGKKYYSDWSSTKKIRIAK